MERYILLVLEYDGTLYAGFQWQPNGPSIQGAVEAAIERLTGAAVRITAAGRTDAGVHARGQVVTWATTSHLPLAEMQRALNALLPPDVAVTDIREVGEDFHARFSAVRRSYRYTIWNTAVRSPLLRTMAYHYAAPLSIAAMQDAAQRLVGTHDFAAFGGPMKKGGSTVRTIYRLACRREENLVLVDIEANAFLSRMVTLRGERMYEFLDKLMNLALPHLRDFRGVSGTSFDGRGNYTLGLREQVVFPEIEYDKVDKVRGMEVSIITTARNDEEGRRLLQLLGMPFEHK